MSLPMLAGGRTALTSALAMLCLMSGCATKDLAGVGGTDSHKCPMPEGGACQSIIENYHDSTRPAARGSRTGRAAARETDRTRIVTLAPGFGDKLDGAPLMSTPRVMRIYITPWRDSDDNLMDGRRVYTRIDEGRWRLDHFDASVKNGALQPALRRSISAGAQPLPAAATPTAVSAALSEVARKKADFFGNIIGTGPGVTPDEDSPTIDLEGASW